MSIIRLRSKVSRGESKPAPLHVDVFERHLRREMDACCVRLAGDEVATDFRLLRACRSTEARRVVSVFDTMGSENRLQTALAMATHPSSRSEFQEKLAKDFQTRLNGPFWAPAIPSELSRAYRIARKGRVRSCFLRELRSAYSSEIAGCGANEYECSVEFNEWRIVTDFDFGGSYQFRPSFRIDHPLLGKRSWRGGVTLGSLLGLGELGWDSIAEHDVENAARAATLMCSDIRDRLQSVLARIDDEQD